MVNFLARFDVDGLYHTWKQVSVRMYSPKQSNKNNSKESPEKRNNIF